MQHGIFQLLVEYLYKHPANPLTFAFAIDFLERTIRVGAVRRLFSFKKIGIIIIRVARTHNYRAVYNGVYYK